MTASNKSWLAVGLLLASVFSACSSVVSVDRSKVEDNDKQFEVPDPPPPDAGSADEEDAG